MLRALICKYAATDTVIYISRNLIHLPRLPCPLSPNMFYFRHTHSFYLYC